MGSRWKEERGECRRGSLYKTREMSKIQKNSHRGRVPFEKKLLPTGIIIQRNYLEIGNALPYRKKCFQELFGSVIPIKSVMDKSVGNFIFHPFFFWRGVLVLLPTHLLHLFSLMLVSPSTRLRSSELFR